MMPVAGLIMINNPGRCMSESTAAAVWHHAISKREREKHYIVPANTG